jgi:hypothetical protein
VAALIDLGVDTVRRGLRTGKLKGVKIGALFQIIRGNGPVDGLR